MEKVDRVERIPLVAFESLQDKNERRERRHFILELVLVLLLVISNSIWIVHEAGFAQSSVKVEQSSDGYNNYIGDGGNITYTLPSENKIE